jgi:hypothetical protein
MPRRLLITVCPREPGMVRLPLQRGGRAQRLGARAIVESLGALIARAGVTDRVRVREGCAGGCSGAGPNVSVTMYPMPVAGERADQIAIGWRTYVDSLTALDCLARVIEENLEEPSGSRRRPPARSARPRRPPAC